MTALARPTQSWMTLPVSSFLPCGGFICRRGSRRRGGLRRVRKERRNRKGAVDRCPASGVELPGGIRAAAQPGQFQIANVDNSRETSKPREEIKHRKIRPVRLNIERHLEIVGLRRAGFR